MKILFTFLFLSASLPKAQANTVSVMVNGQSYQCSPGGESSGCSCKTFKQGSYFYYQINYEGEEIFRDGAYYNAVDALGSCKTKVKSLDACK